MTELRERLAQVQDLHTAGELLGWDQQTMMPPNGGAQRAETRATIARIAHERFVDSRVGTLLDDAASELERAGAGPDSDDVRLVLNTRRDWEKARLVPDELAGEMARAASVGHEAWVAARAANDFDAFAPYLVRNFELARAYADCMDGNSTYECAYDVVLDEYDPGMRTSQVSALFAELKSALVPMIAEASSRAFEDTVTQAEFPIAAQRVLVEEALERMGFNRSGWRLDDTAHPFATSLGEGDVRLTTRYEARHFPTALYGAMHECGHGLYAAGVAPDLLRTPLGELRSLSLHESQSRLWENMVGRSRQFCTWLSPRVAELAGGALTGLDGDTLFRAVNQVQPSLIRIEADEATYGLHIILRFELEQELIEGRLAVADLPEAWNARMREYLGVEVPSDADGVLQDVHWAAGLIGYFSTYALGNLISAQLWSLVREEITDLDTQLATGELGELRAWLGEKVHRHGSKYTSRELVERVAGGPIVVRPYVDYLREKLSDVYEVQLA